MADVRVLDADLIESCATAVTRAHDELWWILHPLEFGAGAVPWQGGTRAQWDDIRRRINNELGYMDADAQYLRERADWTRTEQLKLDLPAMAGLLSLLHPHEPVQPAIPVDPPPSAEKNRAHKPPTIEEHIVAKQATPFDLFVSEKTGQHLDDGQRQYPGECVSLVKNYMRNVLHEPGSLTFRNGGPNWEWDHPEAFDSRWIPIAAGPAIDHAGGYQPGDIVFFKWGRRDPPADHTYQGHIGIVVGNNAATGEVLVFQQNGPKVGDPATTIAFKPSNFVGVMRKK